ncbi:Sur7 [Kluyveromyces lactis]|nr:Sur7 [Kluyveromyces lactis]
MSAVGSILTKFVSLLFLMGSTMLLIFIVLSGSIEHSPVNEFYWLQADTSNITGAPALSRWTFWGLCGVSGNKNVNCSSLEPAYPLSPVDDFGTTEGFPSDFVSNRDTYYYLTRFSFCFFLIALVFIGVGLIFYVLSWCSYSFTKTVFVAIVIGTLLNMAASACQTAATVLAKNAFKDADVSVDIGVKLMAFSWTTVALNIILFFITGASFIRKAYKAHKEFVELQNYKEQALSYEQQQQQLQFQQQQQQQDLEATGAATAIDEPQPQESHQTGIKFFKIRRTQKSDEESI